MIAQTEPMRALDVRKGLRKLMQAVSNSTHTSMVKPGVFHNFNAMAEMLRAGAVPVQFTVKAPGDGR
jgi:hypothetical protein